jgi:serine/threonine protein kinase
MEYADGNSLNNYLKENFVKLTWEDKLKLAYQLASAVLCMHKLHDEDIIHHDLVIYQIYYLINKYYINYINIKFIFYLFIIAF